jgi:4a-hydroxytetrahydrobiopterin dehydratase
MKSVHSTLAGKKCSEAASKLAGKQIQSLLRQVPGWKIKVKQLTRTFRFKNYYETMAFVNATAWISHHQNHHPDMEVGYNKCIMHYSTHSVGGLSENDFICAVLMNALVP